MNRRGRARHAAFGAIAVALAIVAVGCRGILGIHDFEDEPLGQSDGSVDGTNGDGAEVGDTGLGSDGCSFADDPLDPTLLSNVVQVVTGNSFTCALTSDQQIYCWGDNTFGQLGTTPGKELDGGLIPVAFTFAGGEKPIALAAGDSHACALLTPSMKVVCWGDNTNGQSDPSSPDATTAPNHFPFSFNAGALRAGGDHACAFPDSGTVVECWGGSQYFQLGTTGTGNGPTMVGGLGSARVVDLAVGFMHACVLLDDASVKCWGRDVEDQLGVQLPDAESTAIPVFAGLDVERIRAGGNDTCAITSTGVFCVGANDVHQIAHTNSATIVSPSTYDLVASAPTDVALSVKHSCAIVDGQLFCFGDDSSGALGDDNAGGGAVIGLDGGKSFGPVSAVSLWSGFPQTTGSGIRTRDGGVPGGHTCAILPHTCRPGGTLYCWGANGSGELGRGTKTEMESTPRGVQAP